MYKLLILLTLSSFVNHCRCYDEFSIQQMNDITYKSDNNINNFLILSVTGESSTGIFIPDIKVLNLQINLITDKEVDQTLFIKDLSILTNIPPENFRITSILYADITQGFFTTQNNLHKVIINIEVIQPDTTIPEYTKVIMDKIIYNSKNSSLDTSYFSSGYIGSILQKCDNGQYLETCEVSTSSKVIIPVILSITVLVFTMYILFRYKLFIKNKIYKSNQNSTYVKEETPLPKPILNTFVTDNNTSKSSSPIQSITESSHIMPNTVENLIIQQEEINTPQEEILAPIIRKRKLDIVLPQVNRASGINKNNFNDITRAFKRNLLFMNHTTLEFPKKNVYEYSESSDSDSSSSEQSSSSNTPSVSNTNSYINSFSEYSYINSDSKEDMIYHKNALPIVKPIKD